MHQAALLRQLKEPKEGLSDHENILSSYDKFPFTFINFPLLTTHNLGGVASTLRARGRAYCYKL